VNAGELTMVMALLLLRCLFVTVQWCVLNPKFVNPKATQTNQNAKLKKRRKTHFSNSPATRGNDAIDDSG